MVWLRRRRLRSLGWRRIFGGEIPSPSPYCAFLLPRHSQDWPGCCLERGSQPPHIPILDPTLAMARPPPNLDSPTPPRAGPRHVCALPLPPALGIFKCLSTLSSAGRIRGERERERATKRGEGNYLSLSFLHPRPPPVHPPCSNSSLPAKKFFHIVDIQEDPPPNAQPAVLRPFFSCWTKCDEPWPPPPLQETLPHFWLFVVSSFRVQ